MAGESDSNVSSYDTARQNIRDTVKWLVASLSALAAVVVGGISFSGIGALPIPSGRFLLAAGTLLLAFACIAAALYTTLRVLRSDGLYASQLLSGEATADQELRQVRDEIKNHNKELLPLNYPTVDALLQRSQELQQAMFEAIKKDDKAGFESTQQQFKAIDVYISRILDFAVYSRLYHRLENGLRPILLTAAGALLSLLVFAGAVDAPAEQDPKQTGTTIIESGCSDECNPTPTAPDLPPVKFAPGRAEVDRQGVEAIAKASAYLNDNPGAVMLLRAHTDTVASARINRDLAQRRGNAVRGMLLEAGGVAANRVFVAQLPERALPVVTHEDTADERNRTVEFVVAETLQ